MMFTTVVSAGQPEPAGLRLSGSMAPARRAALVAGLIAAFSSAGCASLPRQSFTAAEASAAVVPGFDAVRTWGDAQPRDMARLLDRTKLRPSVGHEVNVLALSGGGAGGAFAAGLLQGWTASGTRPDFDVVTGVSTGALIAPFAFLGSSYDNTLADLYTGSATAGLAQRQPLLDILLGKGLVDPGPLRALVAHYADTAMLAAIAAEHRRGRRLLVVTTNLDAQRPVVWDLSAVAASERPEALTLFREVLVASASIPAVYPPVIIKALSGTRSLGEMHVDGGTATQIFAPPDLFTPEPKLPAAARRHFHLWLVVNNRLTPEFGMTAGGTLPIATRALATFMKSQTIGIVRADAEAAGRLGFDFNLGYIDQPAPYDPGKPFDAAYMDRVFAVGDAEARRGTVWHKSLDEIASAAPAPTSVAASR